MRFLHGNPVTENELKKQIDCLIKDGVFPAELRERAELSLYNHWKNRDMIVWDVADIERLEREYFCQYDGDEPVLTPDEAAEVLHEAFMEHDCNYGITNDRLFDLIRNARQRKERVAVMEKPW